MLTQWLAATIVLAVWLVATLLHLAGITRWRHWRYARYLARHKWFVLLACLRAGEWRVLPLALLHDLSKLAPDEWVPYADWFYAGPHRSRAEYSSYEKTLHWDAVAHDCKEAREDRFDAAWLDHQHRNKHHWQHWLLRLDDGGTKALPMPERYAIEMVLDWRGAGLAQGKPDTLAWYEANRHQMVLHHETRAFVEQMLGYAQHQEEGLVSDVVGLAGWREMSDGRGAFTSTGDAAEDARFEALHRRWEANEAEGLCPNGCGPLEWLDDHNTHCPVCQFSGWTNVPNKGRVTGGSRAATEDA